MGQQIAAGGMHEADHHPPHLAHHFETPAQQFDAAKLGMWLFLVTEILLFGGLFCAYAVYRARHPEVFLYAHKALSVKWGGINTVVLIFSSFTMAMAVYCAQRSKQRGLILGLILTLSCACAFLGIKAVEYHEKWKHGLLWGLRYNPTEHGHEEDHTAATATAPAHGDAHDSTEHHALADSDGTAAATQPAPSTWQETPEEDRSKIAPPAAGPQGLAAPAAGPGDHNGIDYAEAPKLVPQFFGIYFTMTGLHALHVIAGMAVITWLLVRSIKGHFSAEYFTPVDLGGLYWHVVDLVWIYLFPLLYLIH